jgi:hypothetical protein
MNTKLFLFILFVFFFLPLQSMAACTFSVNGATNTVSSSCAFDNALDGLDTGTGNTNTSILRINSGTLTIGANQQIAVGSVNLTGGSLAIIAGGKMLLNTSMWYQDPDGDGVYNSTILLSNNPASNLNAVRKNSTPTPSTFDCNPSGVTKIAHTQCYTDADGDTYTNGLAPNTTCLNAATCALATAASASTDGATVTPFTAGRLRDAATAIDCGDTNATAHPNQGTYSASTFTNTQTGLSFDWNCDGVQTQELTSLYVCNVTGCAAHYYTIANGWSGSAPACGVQGTWNTTAGISAGTCTTLDSTATCASSGASAATQKCL